MKFQKMLIKYKIKDAAGIVTCGKGGRLYQCKGNGMVRDVFNDTQLNTLSGFMGVGHGIRIPSNFTIIYLFS
jgi:amidophosphoribosyltransferase